MDEYIEREALIKKIDEEFDKTDPRGEEQIGFLKCRRIAREIPAADVAPVRHGRWAHNSDFPDRFICYGCGAMFDMWKHEQRLFNY